MRILVTGATGFIGRHLVDRLVRDTKHSIWGASRNAKGGPLPCRWCKLDLEQEGHVAWVMDTVKPDVVFHLAGNPTIKENTADPVGITNTNVVMTHRLLALAPKGCRFVFASSAAVYGNGNCDGSPSNEWGHLEPTAVYGATKIAGEALVRAYVSLGRVTGVSLRLVANVGAGATHGVLRDLIRKAKGDDPNLELLGDHPGSTKHYVHVSDTVDALMYFGLTRTDPYEDVNIANADALSIEQLALLVLRTLGINKPLEWLGEGANWRGDNRQVRVEAVTAAFLGWRAKYGSAEAVVRAIRDME